MSDFETFYFLKKWEILGFWYILIHLKDNFEIKKHSFINLNEEIWIENILIKSNPIQQYRHN